MIRKMAGLVALVLAAYGISEVGAAHAEDAKAPPEVELKLGTLAPPDSAWGKVFKAWAKAVDEESHGKVKLTWYFNGTQGDEIAMVGKMRSKQIDGGAFTATGLAQIYPHIIALQMPGLFPNWGKLDAVRNKTKPKFDAAFEAQGFKILGSGDVGIAHLMSRGKPVRTPEDLKSMQPFHLAGDVIGQKFLETVGVPSPKALTVPAILPALSSRSEGAVNVINTPSIAAEQLQWAAHVDHINTMPSGIGIGALIMNKDKFDGINADLKKIVTDTGDKTGKVLTERIRGIDAQAFDRLKANKTVVDLNDGEKAKWAEVFTKVRNALKAEGKVKADIFDEVTAAAQ